MNINSKFENVDYRLLCKNLSKLDIAQFKTFYAIVVHYWANYRYFISNQNFFNLWCELNQLCNEFDEGFPDPHDDYDKMRSFYKTHPYYFTEKLPVELIAKLFAKHINNRVDILSNIATTLYKKGTSAAYTYANKALCLDESVDELVTETLEHIKYFS